MIRGYKAEKKRTSGIIRATGAAAIAACALASGCLGAGRNDGIGVGRQQHVENETVVTLDIAPASDTVVTPVEMQNFALSLAVTRAQDGEPLGQLSPAAWIDRRETAEPTPADACGVKAERYMGSRFRFQPVLNLHTYFLLALTRASEIAVIDPMMGFGSSRLYTTVLLPGHGVDWVKTDDGRTLFVTIPSEGVVSVVATEGWDVVQNIEAGPEPTRVALEPGGKRLWVTNDAPDAEGGVTVVDVGERAVVKRIKTGRGPHTVTFAPDIGRVFVSNKADGSVAVINAATLETLRRVETGAGPIDMAYAAMEGALYVAHETSGELIVMDALTLERRSRIKLRPGLRVVALSPKDGGHGHQRGGAAPGMRRRLGFVLNYRTDRVHIFDPSGPRVLRTLAVPHGPDQITFSASFAYIRSVGSAEVTMIPLSPDRAVGLNRFQHFPAGEMAPAVGGPVGIAAGIVPGPGMPDAAWVVNPSEETVYYYHYMEGMPTPSGSFETYGFQPIGVMLVGRRFREAGPGRYNATVKLDAAGRYDLVVLLPKRQVVHCFGFAVAENPDIGQDDIALRLESLSPMKIQPGKEVRLRFRLFDAYTRTPATGVDDLYMVLMSTRGWHDRVQSRELDEGVYVINAELPREGVYYLSFGVPSRDILTRDRPPKILYATDAADDESASD